MSSVSKSFFVSHKLLGELLALGFKTSYLLYIGIHCPRLSVLIVDIILLAQPTRWKQLTRTVL